MLFVFVSAGILPQGTLANFEPVNGPGYDSPGFESVRGPGLDAEEFVCNETWVAWENTTEPHYLLFHFFDSRINYTFYDLQVLSGSEPFFYVEYFEEDENGERGRPVICKNPPGQIIIGTNNGGSSTFVNPPGQIIIGTNNGGSSTFVQVSFMWRFFNVIILAALSIYYV